MSSWQYLMTNLRYIRLSGKLLEESLSGCFLIWKLVRLFDENITYSENLIYTG
jgi:hypothetical protein